MDCLILTWSGDLAPGDHVCADRELLAWPGHKRRRPPADHDHECWAYQVRIISENYSFATDDYVARVAVLSRIESRDWYINDYINNHRDPVLLPRAFATRQLFIDHVPVSIAGLPTHLHTRELCRKFLQRRPVPRCHRLAWRC